MLTDGAVIVGLHRQRLAADQRSPFGVCRARQVANSHRVFEGCGADFYDGSRRRHRGKLCRTVGYDKLSRENERGSAVERGVLRIMGSAARVTSAAEGLPRRRFTVAEVEAMVAAGVMEEDERVELIGGELVPMSPKGRRHETVKIALVDRWIRARSRESHGCSGDNVWSQRGYLSRAGRRDLSSRDRHCGARGRKRCCSLSKSPTLRCATTWAARRRCTRASAFANSGSSMRSG